VRTYDVVPTDTEPPHAGTVDGTAWERAAVLDLNRFNWHGGGPRPRTTARVLYDEAALYLQFRSKASPSRSG
jgi:hypothetical protein